MGSLKLIYKYHPHAILLNTHKNALLTVGVVVKIAYPLAGTKPQIHNDCYSPLCDICLNYHQHFCSLRQRNIACTILMTNDKNYVTVQLSMIVNNIMMVVEW